MPLPTETIADHWAAEAGLPVAGSAFGVPLVAGRFTVRNAGGGGTPGVVLDPTADPLDLDERWRTGRALVLHDVVDVDDTLATVRRALPDAETVHRYTAQACEFGDDPEAFAHGHLSSKRRKRFRADMRKLEAIGDVEIRWLEPDEVDTAWQRFRALSIQRVRDTGRWDAAVADGGATAREWRTVGGRGLWINVLSVAGQPISFRTGFAVGDRFVGYMPIVDRGVERVSLGDVHMRLLLPQLRERGVTTYLMGKGSNDHKSVWATHAYSIAAVVAPLDDTAQARLAARVELGRQHARRTVTARGWEHPLRLALHRWHMATDATYREAVEAHPVDSPSTEPAAS